MESVLDVIEDQAASLYDAERCVLRSVRISVPMEAGFPVLLTNWRGEAPAHEALPARTSLEELEDEVLRAAWELGAWDVVRDELIPLTEADDSLAAEESIRVVIGGGPYVVGGMSSGAAELDAEGVIVQLVGLSTQHGAVSWSWLPNAYHPRRRFSGDRTLSPDGRRTPWEGPFHRRPPIATRAGRSHATIMDLGAPLREG